MKKFLLALVVVLVVAVAGAAVYFSQKPGGLQAVSQSLNNLTGSRAAVADHLPADTLVLASLPAPAATGERWKNTDLYKIWTEPEVQTFFAKPLSKRESMPRFDRVKDALVKIKPSNLFVALTALDEKTNEPALVAGFQHAGSKEDVEAALADLKKELRDKYPAAKADLVSYQGQSIETITLEDKKTLAATYYKDWYLVSNGLPVLQSTLDRFENRSPATTKLSDDAGYKATIAKVPAEHETLIYVRAQPLLNRLFTFLDASGQKINPEQRAEMAKIKGLAATTRLDGGKIRDTIYYLAPGARSDYATLAMSSLPLTSADTFLYFASALQLPKELNVPAAGAGPGAAGMAVFQGMFDELSKRGITYEAFKVAFGNEASLQLDWAATSVKPALIFSLAVRDKAAAADFVGKLTSAPLGGATWENLSDAGVPSISTLTIPSVTAVAPTLAVGDKHLLLALNAADVTEAFKRGAAGGPGVSDTEAYKGVVGSVGKPNVGFGYLDSRALFERLYNLLRPMAQLSAGMYPQANEYVDLNKLPNTETIAKHLSPIVYSQALDKEGILLESTGPVTMGQATVVLGGVVGAGVGGYSYMTKSLGTPETTTPAEPEPAETPEPDATPAPAATP